jgi:hypothetical protein
MLNEIMFAIPNIIAAGLILIIAYVVSCFVAKLVEDILQVLVSMMFLQSLTYSVSWSD